MSIFAVTAALGFVAGLLSGLLGIGGGIIMAPLLLYVPPLFGYEPLGMHVVAGLTIVQGLAACLSGVMVHRRFNFVSGELTAWMGATIFFTALLGGAAAKYASSQALLAIFALMAFVAAMLILVPTRSDSNDPILAAFDFSRPKAIAVAGTVGLLGGLVGQGGSFILIPLMTSFLQVPTRIAIGSNLGIVFLASLASFIGKACTGQIAWPLALSIIVAVIPASHLGGVISRRVPVAGLRMLLGVCIAIAAVRLGLSVLHTQ